MRVRFEVDVEGSAASLAAGRFQSEDLSVLHAGVGIGSGANDVAVGVGDDGADVGIRRSEADALAGQFQRPVEKLFVGGVSGHAGEIYHDGGAPALSSFLKRRRWVWRVVAHCLRIFCFR